MLQDCEITHARRITQDNIAGVIHTRFLAVRSWRRALLQLNRSNTLLPPQPLSDSSNYIFPESLCSISYYFCSVPPSPQLIVTSDSTSYIHCSVRHISSHCFLKVFFAILNSFFSANCAGRRYGMDYRHFGLENYFLEHFTHSDIFTL